MTKKKYKEPKEFNYAEFSIQVTKLCMKLSSKISKIIYSFLIYIYKRIRIWLALRQLTKEVINKMFTKKELYELKNTIDQYVPTDNAKVMDIRAKIFDMIKLMEAWESNRYIQCSIIDNED